MSVAKASTDTKRIGYINVLTALVLLVGVRIFSMEDPYGKSDKHY